MSAGVATTRALHVPVRALPSESQQRSAARWAGVSIGAGAALTIGGLAAARGGYFPTSWGWVGTAFAWVAAVALILGAAPGLTRLETIFLGGLTAFAGWIGLSTLWSASVTNSVLETERAIVYPLGVFVALLLVRRASVRQLLGGVLTAVTAVCAYALATSLFSDQLGRSPDSIIGQRLASPLGYWNALGTFAAMGVLLALGFAARARSWWARAAGAASLVVLAPTLYLTFSRGAWISLAVGIVFAVAVDGRPLQLVATLLAAGPAPALAVLFTSRSHIVSLAGNAAATAVVRDGHRLALLIFGLAAASALAIVAFGLLEERVEIAAPLRRLAAIALIATVLVGMAAGSARYGTPPTLARKAWRAFNAPSPTVHGSLNNRLFNLSGSGRNVQYRAAWHEFLQHPLIGSGAGTYERYWLEERPLGTWKIRDAHSLYIETLGELGGFGLLLLCCGLAAPLVALFRTRRSSLVSSAAGAYVVYLLHAGFDWDWEMTAVTLVALLCGAALLRSGGRETPPSPAPRPRRAAVLVAVAAAGVFSLVGLVGNTATAQSARAVQGRHWLQAERSARTARTWAPWSSEPLMWLGEAEVGRNELGAAQRNLHAAIAKDPGSWELWFDLALASRRGAYAQRHALAVALQLNPLSPEVREFMAGIELSMQRVNSA